VDFRRRLVHRLDHVDGSGPGSRVLARAAKQCVQMAKIDAPAAIDFADRTTLRLQGNSIIRGLLLADRAKRPSCAGRVTERDGSAGLPVRRLSVGNPIGRRWDDRRTLLAITGQAGKRQIPMRCTPGVQAGAHRSSFWRKG